MVHMVLACVSVSFLIFHVSPLSPVTVVHVECQSSHFHGPISPCDVSLIFFFLASPSLEMHMYYRGTRVAKSLSTFSIAHLSS